jgi:Zn-dependent protease with chaperone function
VAERLVGAGQRRLSATSAAMFALVAAIWASSLLLVAPLGYALGLLAFHAGVAGLLLASAAWTASGALMLSRPVAARLGHLLFPVRRPRREELQRIRPLWQQVCAHAATHPDRYLLRIETSERLNAFAMGGHLVALTQAALALPDDMLAAVLAHELGHHRQLHPVATALGWWYRLPFLAADRLLRAARRAVRALRRAFAVLRERATRISGGASPLHGALGVLGLLLVLGALVALTATLGLALLAAWLPLALLVRISLLVSAALSRAAEYAADRHAVDLGFGSGLARVLELFDAGEHATPRPRGLATLTRTHPSCRARIDAIRRRPAGARPAHV